MKYNMKTNQLQVQADTDLELVQSSFSQLELHL